MNIYIYYFFCIKMCKDYAILLTSKYFKLELAMTFNTVKGLELADFKNTRLEHNLCA